MSLGTMRQELLGIPGTNFGLVTTKLNEAFSSVQDENVWSFQLKEGGWLTPGLFSGPNTPNASLLNPNNVSPFVPGPVVPNTTNFLSPGKITVPPYSSTVTGDPVATKAWNAAIFLRPFLTEQQFRVPYYSLYNIVAIGNNGTLSYVNIFDHGAGQTPGTYMVPVMDGDPTVVAYGGMVSITVEADGTVQQPPEVVSVGAGYVTPVITFNQGGMPAVFTVVLTATLTLDRPWMEPNQVNTGYLIYQAYFPAPPGFKRWYFIFDPTNNCYIDWWSYTQINLSEFDAQRINFLQPSHAVPYGIDTRPNSATLGQMLYELWPHPIMQLPYTYSCQANWPPLVLPTDCLPFPLTDSLIKYRANEILYLWKEAQRGNEMERGSGANWSFLSQAMRAEYTERLKKCRNMDRHLVDLYFTKVRRMLPVGQQVFGTITGQASVGGWDS